MALVLLVPGSVSVSAQNQTMVPPSPWVPLMGDSTCFFANDYNGTSGNVEECRIADGLSLYNIQTGERIKPLPFRNGLPICNDPAY